MVFSISSPSALNFLRAGEKIHKLDTPSDCIKGACFTSLFQAHQIGYAWQAGAPTIVGGEPALWMERGRSEGKPMLAGARPWRASFGPKPATA